MLCALGPWFHFRWDPVQPEKNLYFLILIHIASCGLDVQIFSDLDLSKHSDVTVVTTIMYLWLISKNGVLTFSPWVNDISDVADIKIELI